MSRKEGCQQTECHVDSRSVQVLSDVEHAPLCCMSASITTFIFFDSILGKALGITSVNEHQEILDQTISSRQMVAITVLCTPVYACQNVMLPQPCEVRKATCTSIYCRFHEECM